MIKILVEKGVLQFIDECMKTMLINGKNSD